MVSNLRALLLLDVSAKTFTFLLLIITRYTIRLNPVVKFEGDVVKSFFI